MTEFENLPERFNPQNKSLWLIIVFIGLLLLFLLFGIQLFQGKDQPLELGKPISDFTLHTFNGEVIQTEDLQGMVVLVNFWASWCDTCDEESIFLEQAWQNYLISSEEEVLFLGVAYMDTESAAEEFLTEFGVTFPNGMDLRGDISALFRVNAVPETYILDQKGNLAYLKLGPFTSQEQIMGAVNDILRQSHGVE